jgi:hypothetical protein
MTMAPDQPGAMTTQPSRGDTRPVPDPTVLTTQQLYREITSLKEVISTRLDGMDRAIVVLQATANRSPTPGEIDLDLESFKSLVDEKFRTVHEKFEGILTQAAERFKTVDERFGGVALQFKERDTRSERESRDNKVAVDAAFAAQKEAASEQNKSNTLAIDKSEKATAETLNKQADLFKSTTDALAGRIEDAKQLVSKIDTRVTTIESRGVGVIESRTQGNWQIGAIISGLALLISFAGLVVVLVKLG